MLNTSQYRRVIAAIILACLAYPVLAVERLYRYENEQGVLVIDHSIPPRFVGKGYEILSKHGQVLEAIAPADTESSEARLAREKALALREKEDRFILISFSTVAEIEAAKRRKLAQVEWDIKIIEANIKDTHKRIAVEQNRAANYQRGGVEVPESLYSALTDLEAEIEKAQALLTKRHQDYELTDKLYSNYAQRFLELKEDAKIGSDSTATQ